jgi:two-component system NtrC family sensor kinase
MAHEKVLIIDDRRENVVFLADQILRPDGYQVITAGDGEAGLEKALSEHPDLIVMDIRMPKMTGIDVLQALKDAGQEIPVIVTTFHGSEELAIQAFRLGARDYLIKPYEVEEMVVAIDRILAAPRRFRQERQVLEEDMARTSKQLERRVKELHILSGIGKAVTSLHKVETILQRIVEAATYLTGAEEAFLMLVDEDSGDLHMRAVQGMGKKYQRFRQKVDDSIAGQVVRTGRAVRIGQSRSQGTHEVMTGYLVRDLLNVPLKVREKVIGVLGVDNLRSQGGFTENDEYLLSALADYAAIAIDNARLYELMEERTKKLARMVTSQAESRREQDQAQIERLRAREQRFTEERAKIAQIAERLSHLCIQLQGVGMRLDETSEPEGNEG